jgi:TM2 domain-containing membrane protein YozV
MYCSKCGTQIAEGTLFCPKCGTAVSVGVSPSSADQTRRDVLIPASISDNLPTMVREGLGHLAVSMQEQFLEEYRRKIKSTGIAYLLWFILGLHYVYLGKWGLTLLMWLTLYGLLVWWFIDIFRIPGMVRNHNKDVAVDVFRTLKAIGA